MYMNYIPISLLVVAIQTLYRFLEVYASQPSSGRGSSDRLEQTSKLQWTVKKAEV
jgi:hypothetical protein